MSDDELPSESEGKPAEADEQARHYAIFDPTMDPREIAKIIIANNKRRSADEIERRRSK